MLRQLTADRLARRGQGGFALMAGLAIWVGVCGISMVALLNMTMTSSRIATKQAEAATELRAVDSAMETAVAQVRMDPDAVIGASTGKGDGTCIQQLGARGSDALEYRDDSGILVTVTATCQDAPRNDSRLRDADMAQENAADGATREPTQETESPRRLSSGKRINSSDDAAGLNTRQSVRSVALDAVMTLPDGTMRSAGTALIRVSDARGNGASLVIDDWSLTPSRPYVPPTTTTTTTAPPTTTTTTTAVPTGATRSRWTATARESQGNDWRAVATLEVVSTSGAPVDGATVTVRPEYLVSGSSTWVTAADIVGTTNATGASTFHSAYYRRTGGSRITEVRFTVAGVATTQGLPWDNLASEPLTVVVALN